MTSESRKATWTAPPTTVVDSEAEYAEKAAEFNWPEASIPLLRRPAGTGGTLLPLPMVNHDNRPHFRGVVFACDRRFSAAAAVLARATHRPLHHGDATGAVALSLATPVTVVAELATVSPAFLAALPYNAQIGFVTGRDLVAVTTLVARTIVHGPAVMPAMPDLSFDTKADENLGPGWLTADMISPARLRAALGNGVAVLSGRAHARYCLMHLKGGGICGRAEEQPLLPVLPPIGTGYTEHPTACQQGPCCFRDDFQMSDHLRAADIRAAFVVLDSCRTAIAGGARIRSDVSIPLTMLESNSLAVVAAVGTRGGAPFSAPLYRALLHAGAALGEALSETNGAIAAAPDGVGRLALFGDAGLVPSPNGAFADSPRQADGDGGVDIPAGIAAEPVGGGQLIARDRGGPLVVRRAGKNAAWALTSAYGRSGGRIVPAPARLDDRWIHRVRPWLERIRGFPAMGLRADSKALDEVHRKATRAVRARAEAQDLAAAHAAEAGFTAAERDLAAMQYRILEGEIEVARTGLYTPVSRWPQPWQAHTAEEPGECPQCRDRTAFQHSVRSAAGVGPPLTYVVCVRCGEMTSGVAEFPAAVAVDNPPEVRRGDAFAVVLTVTASPATSMAIALGATFNHEERWRCRLGTSHALTLRAGESRRITFTGIIDDEAIPDLQPFRIMLAADGAWRCLTRSVWIRI